MKTVWVELGLDGRAIRIFRNKKSAYSAYETPGPSIAKLDRSQAVREIRRQIYDRQQGRCLYCPTLLSWAGMHLHEKQHRGQGGEISLANSAGLCYNCHINGEHGDRKPNFQKVNE